MDIELKRLNQVLTVVKTGSFSQAAKELHLSQPALSRSIAVLESRYGMRIFERDRGGATLTATGKLIVSEAEELIRKARSLDHNFKLYGRGEAGKVAFGMGPLIASLILPAMSLHCLRERPMLHLRSEIKSSGILYEELMADHIEILFIAAGQLHSKKDLHLERVGKLSLALIARGEHPLLSKDTITLDEVLAYPVLSGAEISTITQKAKVGSFICDNYHILKETTLYSDAIWASSPELVRAELAAGQLAILNVASDTLHTTAEVYMASRQDNQLSPSAEFIRDYVRQYLETSNNLGTSNKKAPKA